MSGIVAVIDYGMGNLHSVASALEHVGADEVLVTHDAELIRRADRVAGRAALQAEVAGGIDKTFTEVVEPYTIHKDTSR